MGPVNSKTTFPDGTKEICNFTGCQRSLSQKFASHTSTGHTIAQSQTSQTIAEPQTNQTIAQSPTEQSKSQTPTEQSKSQTPTGQTRLSRSLTSDVPVQFITPEKKKGRKKKGGQKKRGKKKGGNKKKHSKRQKESFTNFKEELNKYKFIYLIIIVIIIFYIISRMCKNKNITAGTILNDTI
jgi:hypothetical protein